MVRSYIVRVAAPLSLAILLVAQPAIGQQTAPSDPAARMNDPAVWRIDKSHSELIFRIRHFMGRVHGTFRDWSGTIVVDDPAKWETASIDVAIRTASIFTDHERRDADLRSVNFFAADSFPVITFTSTRIERQGDEATIHGNLTIRGVTRSVILDGRFLGLSRFPNNVERVGFEATTTIQPARLRGHVEPDGRRRRNDSRR